MSGAKDRNGSYYQNRDFRGSTYDEDYYIQLYGPFNRGYHIWRREYDERRSICGCENTAGSHSRFYDFSGSFHEGIYNRTQRDDYDNRLPPLDDSRRYLGWFLSDDEDGDEPYSPNMFRGAPYEENDRFESYCRQQFYDSDYNYKRLSGGPIRSSRRYRVRPYSQYQDFRESPYEVDYHGDYDDRGRSYNNNYELMSYWGTYEDNLHGQQYPEYQQQYYNSMRYYNGQEYHNYPVNTNYGYQPQSNDNNGHLQQQQQQQPQQQQPGPSQVTSRNYLPTFTYEQPSSSSSMDQQYNGTQYQPHQNNQNKPQRSGNYYRNNGAVRKKFGDRNHQSHWNNNSNRNNKRNYDNRTKAGSSRNNKTTTGGGGATAAGTAAAGASAVLTAEISGENQATPPPQSQSTDTFQGGEDETVQQLSSNDSQNVQESNNTNKNNKSNNFNKMAENNYGNKNFYNNKNNYTDRRSNNYNNKKDYNNKYSNNGYYENHRNNYGKYNNRKFNNRGYDEGGGYRNKNNWRRDDHNGGSSGGGGGNGKRLSNGSAELVQKKLDAASQRERLEEMLTRRLLECLVCCEKVKNTDKIWTCQQCYLILHLSCTTAWANSCKPENGWRCPACQNVYNEIPNKYLCYCGKTPEPSTLPGVLPHACGEPCMRKGRLCEHKCQILCHPGPCPDCMVMVAKPCGCGKTTQTIKCSSDNDIICDSICNKLLECEVHYCQMKCHMGDCNPCDKTIEQVCFCGKVGRRVKCNGEYKGATQYNCDDICGKPLSCGNHKCEKQCHDGPCDSCSKDIDLVKYCPCGKTKLEITRSSCLDPIPCCDKICGKILKCGQPAAPHTCKVPCHDGDCPPCPLTTLVRCRCGHMGKDIKCEELTTKADDARCEKKCTKKRLCGKHRCNQRCCIEVEHICPLPCNHLLACGQHRCDMTCHSGRCPPCMETSFEELYCECGAQVLYPPIPCGTRPPVCDQPCSRPRPCGHEVNHSCHTGACPPCTVLCKRWCHGQHEQRSAIPCYQEDFSCGLPCGKPMPCGTHKCDKICHTGPCPLPCKQKCIIKRALCGHPCNAPCHQPPCPESSCRASVPITCPCGLQKSSKPCIELIDEYKEFEMAQIKDKMTELLKDQPVDITDVVNKPKRPTVFKILECTEECRVLERNRRLAIGLQIRNPDISQKLTPRYSDFMRGWAKKDPQFCQRIHDKLTELVQLAKQSKQKSRSHSFESMNRDKRHFVHEYCEHFGCESAAYDQEPNRNIVATASKDKSWLPSMSLLEVIQRENGHRKVPGPVMKSSSSLAKTTYNETVSLKLPGRSQQRPASPPPKEIDYFDNPPQ